MMGSGLGTRGTPGECRVWLASKIYTRLPPEECKWMEGMGGGKRETKLVYYILSLGTEDGCRPKSTTIK